VPSFAKSLLVVDDTRYEPDSYLGTGVRKNYGNPWPSAAEFDTLMYAKGGGQWQGYPEPTITPPGIFHGYDFDTIGTRRGIADLSTSLATLGGYRHVIWLIDFQSATFGASGNVPVDPMTSFRYMNIPGHLNSLGAYIRMGGEGWLVGGGGALASLITFDDIANNGGGGSYIWNSSNVKPELVPGRFMYDAAKWQSVIRDRTGIQIANNPVRSLGRFQFNPGVYASVPPAFTPRTSGADPLPPGRANAQYYPTNYACEFINSDNIILEAVNGDPIDFLIDSFDDANPVAMVGRWPSSDTLNTTASQGDVTAAGTTKAATHSLKIHTQGGGASTGDSVTRTFDGVRDWSGLNFFKFDLKQDQPVASVQWRVRAIDDNGSSASVLVDPGVTNQFAELSVPQGAFVPDPASPRMINWLRIHQLQLTVATANAAGTSAFDNLEVITLPEGPVLDTLLAARLSFGANPPINATMTVYHGHDFQRPFVFTGFAPWNFRIGQCQDLFDFVLQKLWGLPKTTGTFVSSRSAPFIPAHQVTRRPSVVTGVSGAVLRQGANLGALQRRNGNP
jgi:hypothetical protein